MHQIIFSDFSKVELKRQLISADLKPNDKIPLIGLYSPTVRELQTTPWVIRPSLYLFLLIILFGSGLFVIASPLLLYFLARDPFSWQGWICMGFVFAGLVNISSFVAYFRWRIAVRLK